MQLSRKNFGASIILIVVLASAVCFIAYRFAFSSNGNPSQQKDVSKNPDIHGDHKKRSLNSKTSVEKAGGTLPSVDMKDILRSANSNRWIVAEKLLSALKPSELWGVLNSPSISDQVQSKAMRFQLLKSCIPTLKKIANSAPITQSVVTEACSDLSKIGDISYFTNEYMKLNADRDFQTSDFRIPIPDPKTLSPSQIQQEWDLAKAQLTQSNDPNVASYAVRHMWWTQSPDIYGNWSEINALSVEQRDQLMQVIATDVPCSMIGGCASNSPWTIYFCTLVPGTICPPGRSYDEIVNLNLSRIQLDLRQKILSTLPPTSSFH